MFVLLHLNLL